MKSAALTLSVLLFLFIALDAEGQNLLVNGDFESSPPNGSFPAAGWKPGWYPAQAGAVCTSTAAMEGNCGLWIYTAAGSEAFCRPYQEVKCSPLTEYRAQAFFRCPPGQSWTAGTTAFVSLTFKNSSGVTLKKIHSETMVSGTNEWKEYSVSLRAPEGTSRVRYTVNLTSSKGMSVCNADNCSLEAVR